MIVGIGSDLCNIERIQTSLDRFGDRFIQRCFTEIEQAKAERRTLTRAATYAKRFAAKEAFSKAVGTGFKRGVFLQDIGVVNLPSGAPTLALTGGAKARLDALIPPGHAAARASDDDRRPSLGAGLRHHRGAADRRRGMRIPDLSDTEADAPATDSPAKPPQAGHRLVARSCAASSGWCWACSASGASSPSPSTSRPNR